MSHPLRDPSRLAALRALGLPQAFALRSALDAGELSELLPQPAVRAAQSASPSRAADAPPARREAPAPLAPAPRPTPAAQAQPRAAGSRLEQIDALDIDGLRALSEQCRACKLGAQRHRAVFAAGHPGAPLMIVGEAPGADEDRLGEPFVGAAGKLLDNMLRAIGLDRTAAEPAHAAYIANVIKCRPPGNRNPEPDEVAQCEPILQRQIALVRPRVLLALGRFAAQALTGSTEPIGRLRQQRLRYRDIPVVVTYHPAYLLRTPLDKAKAWADLCAVRDLLDAGASDSPA